MFKKILCLVMILMMVAGIAAVGVSAATEKTKLYFQVPSDWGGYSKIFCHIWQYGSETALSNWQSKKEACKDEGNGIWSFDPAKVGGISDGVTYCVIFSADTGMQTYDAVMTTACLGDTLYCDGTKFENPADSNKTALSARWKSNTQYGPVKAITSIGNIVGETYVDTPANMFTDFLKNKLGNAQTYSGKADQQLLDDTAKALGLGQETVAKLIKDSGVSVAWDAAKSTLDKEDSAAAKNPTLVGTGQEMTVVYVAVAMMIAAAGVVLFARKKATK